MCREAFDWEKMAADLEPEIEKYERLLEKLNAEPGRGIEATALRLCYEDVLVELKMQQETFPPNEQKKGVTMTKRAFRAISRSLRGDQRTGRANSPGSQ